MLAASLLCLACGHARADFKDTFEPQYTSSAEDATALIQNSASLPGGESLKPLLEGPLSAYSGGVYRGVTNSYRRGGESGTRFLSIRLTVVNRGTEKQTFPRSQMILTAGGDRLVMGDFPPRFGLPRYSDLERHASMDVPAEVIVGPGQAVTFWCLFAPLDPSIVSPPFSLDLESKSGAKLAVDVSAQQAARLGLEQERLGPRNALPVFTIHGELNTVNAVSLAEKVSGLVQDGLERLIIAFADKAQPVSLDIQMWLLRSGMDEEPNNVVLERLPVLPKLRQLSLANVPDKSESVLGMDNMQRNVFESPERAVTSALGGVLRQLTPTELLQELRQGHAWSKIALLETCGDRLGSGAWPLLAEMSRSPDSRTRRLALAGLAHQDLPQARAILEEGLRSGDPDLAESALRAVLSREDLNSRQQVQAALDSGAFAVPIGKVVLAVAEFYHPDWNPLLLAAVKNPDAAARRDALDSLRVVGHPELGQLCLDSLADADDGVRETAFRGLAECPESQFERAAVDYVLKRLAAGQTSRQELELVERLKVTRAAPLLIALIDSRKDERSHLIDVLGELADLEQLRWLMTRLEGFDADEQASVMELAKRLPAAEQMELARRTITAESPALKSGAVELLQSSASPEAVTLIAEKLRSESDDEMERACYALAQIGTPPAMAALAAFRDEIFEKERRAAYRPVESAFELWRGSQPGWAYVSQGHLMASEDGEDKALKYFDLAVAMNPEFAAAYSARGNIYLRMYNVAISKMEAETAANQLEKARGHAETAAKHLGKARKDYEDSVRLDKFDNQGLTGVALMLAIDGQWEQGLKTVEDKLGYFSEQRPDVAATYTYNTACVMGRSIEFLEKQPQTSERNDRIADLRRKSVRHLKESLDLGFEDLDWMQKDPDLKPLQALPEFLELIPENRRISPEQNK